MFKSEPAPIDVRMESEPAGAEAKAPSGAVCRTPCTLPLPDTGTTVVSFDLQGYQPQSVPVTITPPEGGFAGMGASEPRIDPNPVFATLELTPPPPPPRKKKAAPKRAPQPRPAAAAPAAQEAPPPAAQMPPPQQQPGFGPPNAPPPSSVFR